MHVKLQLHVNTNSTIILILLLIDIQIAKRQIILSPNDVYVIDVMEADGVLMVVFVVGSESVINSAEMINILQIEGARIAQALQDSLNALVS